MDESLHAAAAADHDYDGESAQGMRILSPSSISRQQFLKQVTQAAFQVIGGRGLEVVAAGLASPRLAPPPAGCARYRSGAAPSLGLERDFPPRLGSPTIGAGASVSLFSLAFTHHRKFMHSPLPTSTTHLSYPPCFILQARNSFQQLGVSHSTPWHYRRPFAGHVEAPEGTTALLAWNRALPTTTTGRSLLQQLEAHQSTRTTWPTDHPAGAGRAFDNQR
jgi:hypothetical protein